MLAVAAAAIDDVDVAVLVVPLPARAGLEGTAPGRSREPPPAATDAAACIAG